MGPDTGSSESLLRGACLDTTNTLGDSISQKHGYSHSHELSTDSKDTAAKTNLFQRCFGFEQSNRRHDSQGSQIASEHSPLLRQISNSNPFSSPSILDDQVDVTWQQESKIIVKYSAPLIVTSLLQLSITATSVFVVGKLGAIELGAVSCRFFHHPCVRVSFC